MIDCLWVKHNIAYNIFSFSFPHFISKSFIIRKFHININYMKLIYFSIFLLLTSFFIRRYPSINVFSFCFLASCFIIAILFKKGNFVKLFSLNYHFRYFSFVLPFLRVIEIVVIVIASLNNLNLNLLIQLAAVVSTWLN